MYILLLPTLVFWGGLFYVLTQNERNTPMLKTAESVRAGHPDKLCDFIADCILERTLYEDPAARVAVEVLATKARIYVAGEITCSAKLEIPMLVRAALEYVGYNPRRFRIRVRVHRQSSDIADGVDKSLEARHDDTSSHSMVGAGDQGTVYGYATAETQERLPLPLVYAHRICRRLDEAFKEGKIPELGPDGKAQVTVEYDGNSQKRIATIVVSTQHQPGINVEDFKQLLISLIITPACREIEIDTDTEILINPSGRFVEGGPAADTGLTGRKLMVDTYGGLAPHGGGAFSGKDPSKVDRTGAYMARLIAKSMVDAGLAEQCQVAISYAIGKADPVAFSVDTLGTGAYAQALIEQACREVFPLRPAGIIEALKLGKHTRFAQYSTYGHFGDLVASWEQTLDWATQLRRIVKGDAW